MALPTSLALKRYFAWRLPCRLCRLAQFDEACHVAMDAVGLGAENYDAFGQWRTAYGDKMSVDASGTPHPRRFAAARVVAKYERGNAT